MASKAQRLGPVIDMAERAEREAAGKFAQGRLLVEQAEAKLAELERYFSDYQQQWMREGSRGVTGQWLMNYQRFLSQLELAIEQQRRSLAWHRDNLAKLQAVWQQRHARLEGLRKLVERYLREARAAADRHEQKVLDDFCQRLAGRTKPS